MQHKLLLVGTIILVLGILSGKAETMATVGGWRDIQDTTNSNEINELAQFAVEQHNTKENARLSLKRVVKAQQQVVAGMQYRLTLEATEGQGEPTLYEAVVWVKPWGSFKSLENFKPVPSPASVTSADLGVKKEHLQGSGWREVSVDDPAIQEAAEYAVKNIQQRSNSLAAYVLQEVLLAKAEIIDDLAKFDLLLKTKRGAKEEEHKVEMHRSLDGIWILKSHSV